MNPSASQWVAVGVRTWRARWRTSAACSMAREEEEEEEGRGVGERGGGGDGREVEDVSHVNVLLNCCTIKIQGRKQIAS